MSRVVKNFVSPARSLSEKRMPHVHHSTVFRVSITRRRRQGRTKIGSRTFARCMEAPESLGDFCDCPVQDL